MSMAHRLGQLNEAENAWGTDNDPASNSPLPPDTTKAASNAWSSDTDPHQREVPSLIPSCIIHSRLYSAFDFGFVDDSWLPSVPVGEGKSSMDDGDFSELDA
jgi:hypothetical protein